MATPLRLAMCLLFFVTVSADVCPPFANARSSCTSSSCGHFVYKGKFQENTQHHRLAAVADGIFLSTGTATPASCCNQCRQADGCAYWSLQVKAGLCVLYASALCGDAATGSENPAAYDPTEADSYVGGMCLQPVKVEASSPMVAVDAVKPLEEKSFCLVSDKNLHINMLLGGYFDSRTSGAKSVRNGMTVRTWIREMAFLWKVKGKVHTLDITARRGSEKERKDGYLESIRIDGTSVPRLTLGDQLNFLDGHVTLSLESYEKTGPYDVDVYKIRIQGLLEAELRFRIAHPLLQLESDAEVHMNMDILDLNYSEKVHGLLGQTYRADRLDQALNYAVLSDLMFVSNSADSAAEAVGSMDGAAAQYLTSSITAPDCGYSQFDKVPALPVATGLAVGEMVTAAAGAVKQAVLKKSQTVEEVVTAVVEDGLPETAQKMVVG